MHKLVKPTRPLGFATVYVVILFTALVGMATFAVDYGKLTLSRTQLRTAVDAATLAAGTGLRVSPAEARTRAKTIAQGNTINGRPLTLLDSDIQFGMWNSTTKLFTLLTGASESGATAVRINGQASSARGSAVDMVFLPLIQGRRSCDLAASSVACFAAAVDVVIVQDVTQSFSEELSDAKIGDRALLDSLYTNGGKSGFGVVAFSGWGKTISPLRLVTSNYTTLANAITSLKLAGNWGMPPRSGTDIAAGIEKALEVFQNYTAPSATGKAMIIVSDGTPTQSSSGMHPTLNESKLLTLAQRDADTAWSRGIHVYVVFFDRDNDASASNRLKSLIRGQGIYVRVSDPRQLPTALASITRNLPLQLVN